MIIREHTGLDIIPTYDISVNVKDVRVHISMNVKNIVEVHIGPYRLSRLLLSDCLACRFWLYSYIERFLWNPFLIGVYRLNITLRYHDTFMILYSMVQREYHWVEHLCRFVERTIELGEGDKTWVFFMCYKSSVFIINVCILYLMRMYMYFASFHIIYGLA